jgi:hypothetical protein
MSIKSKITRTDLDPLYLARIAGRTGSRLLMGFKYTSIEIMVRESTLPSRYVPFICFSLFCLPHSFIITSRLTLLSISLYTPVHLTTSYESPRMTGGDLIGRLSRWCLCSVITCISPWSIWPPLRDMVLRSRWRSPGPSDHVTYLLGTYKATVLLDRTHLI